MGRRYRQTDFTSEKHGGCCAYFYCEASRWRDGGEVFADRLDDATTPEPKADRNAHAAVQEDQEWRFGFLLNRSFGVYEP